ncbi:ORF6C domain-containing protein [Caminicella sporogenes]|uniref:ORF6C domain-containing protein n=1 Tax=Caminicella sporogenes TaxID=166485 RepID=UPI002542578D|nr:ORF6C domain-containing protein [Caminicella sporogenes]WIF95052.1 ORF6C domain-containing protein [Caminicella sporogenes]WIF95162.1 ORF6C domain-containing protein [Caminicella sporogenes]
MKNDLGLIIQDGQVVVSSRDVAERFNKRHDQVLRDIDSLLEGLHKSVEAPEDYFQESQYQHEQNKQWYREFKITKKGFQLLAMGFNGQKALEWKIKYINAFELMEQQIKEQSLQIKKLSPMEQLKLQYQVLDEHEKRLNDLENNMPLFNIECKELQALVRKKGIEVLGGYRSPAYCNNSIRGKVYSDIQRQLKREFGVSRYEAIKRSQFELAKQVILDYKAPLVLVEEIEACNNQIQFQEVS